MRKNATKVLATVAAIALACTTAFAATETRFDYEHVVELDPSYEIIIPASVRITSKTTAIPIEVANAKDFGTGYVAVKMKQTVPNGNFMALDKLKETPPAEEGWWSGTKLPYDLITADGTEILYNRDGSWDTQYLNAELATFTGDAVKSYSMILDINEKTQPGKYGGLIQYTVEFVKGQ